MKSQVKLSVVFPPAFASRFATITYIASLAGLVFHLHHYTLACFVFPITAYQTRTSAFLQVSTRARIDQ